MKQQRLFEQEINVTFSTEMLKVEKAIVADIYQYKKNEPYKDFFCVGFFENNAYAQKLSFILCRNDSITNAVVKEHAPENLDGIPPLQLVHAIESGCFYTHVLVQRRIFYGEKQEDRLTIVIDPKRTSLGYYSNSTKIDDDGLRELKELKEQTGQLV